MTSLRQVFKRLMLQSALEPKRPQVNERTLVAVVSLALLVVFFALDLSPRRLELQVGQVAPQAVRAPRDLLDETATDALRQAAIAEVKDVYESDPRVAAGVQQAITAAFDYLAELREGALTRAEQAQLFSARHPQVGGEQVAALLAAPAHQLEHARAAALEVARVAMVTGIKPEALDMQRARVSPQLAAAQVAPGIRPGVASLVAGALEPNLVHNAAETTRRRLAAAEAVEPVRIFRGSYILRAGDVVTGRHLELLHRLGMLQPGLHPRAWSAAFLLALGIVLYHGAYLYAFKPALVGDSRKLLILSVVFLGVLAISGGVGGVSWYLVPVAAGTMLLATMLDGQVAMASGMAMSLAVGVMAGGEFRVFAVAVIGGLAGVYAISRVANRYALMRAGFVVAAANVAGLFTMSLVLGPPLNHTGVWQSYLWAALNGVASTILTIGLLPFFEGLFKIITPMKLIELANPNQPLLNRLLTEAPGTYHHSIIVGNLAEAAVEAVGGDSLLARVGAYYHDVGKCKRPYFFIENQMGMEENPHDRIAPGLSTLIITAHVKDGVEMAKEARLPEPVIDFIREHHGTTVVSYFYWRASENGKGGAPAAEDDYRYEGPRPQSKETAIVMLADSMEAAVRALGRPVPARIEHVVRTIIKERLNDHQLDGCDLTLKDLDTIATSFIRVLSGIFHPRIEYPEAFARKAALLRERRRRPADPGEARDEEAR
jgi:putative nucleotidyltransferase with HDIG domain